MREQPTPAVPPFPGPAANGPQGASPNGAPAPAVKGRRRRRRRSPVGASPGLLQPDPEARPSIATAMAFGPENLQEEVILDVARIVELRKQHPVVWIDVHGIGDIALLKRLGETFGLHRLALEDVVNTHQRAKVEDYGAHEFVVLRMLDTSPVLETEQFAMFLGAGFVLTFQERPGDCFGLVRQRVRDPEGQMRRRGADYLAYALLDAVVDAYFPVLENLGEALQEIEEATLAEGDTKTVVGDLHGVRRSLLTLRRALWPLREVASSLTRAETKHFCNDVRVYLRDVQDHIVQLLDLLENHRELASSLLELHLSVVNHRLNEVMKVLTIIATIFIPLTFVVGVYGMNFDWMPELEVWWAYPACWLVMLSIAATMLAWFRRRGWL